MAESVGPPPPLSPSFALLSKSSSLAATEHRQLISENAFLVMNFLQRKAIQKLNYVEQVQEVSGELKEPPGIALKGSNYHEPATDVGNKSTGGSRDDDVGKEVQDHMIAMIFDGMIPKTCKGKKAALPVSKDMFISKMFLRGDLVIIVLRNPK